MDQSARIILLITDNYIREGWKHYEYEHIIYAAIEQGNNIHFFSLETLFHSVKTKSKCLHSHQDRLNTDYI